MSKFNTASTRTTGRGPVAAEATPTATSHEGVPGYARDLKGELFLLAVTNFVAQSTFYETGPERDERYRALVAQVSVADPGWTAGFLSWLRTEANMRTAPLMGALEAARAMALTGVPGGRQIVASVLQRADEPGEALAYWTSHYGRSIPKPVKRGIADAAMRLYAEYPLLKYDTGLRAVRFADVLELTHPGDRRGSSQGGRWRGAWQGDLFKHAIDRRHGRDNPTPESLATIRANAALRKLAGDDPQAMFDTDRLRAAGMTWEDVLSLVGSKVDKAKLWEALIPTMGYMALLRNLRNFDQAGVEDAVAEQVAKRLADPAEVARSKQFPFRFYAAYKAVGSLRWSAALERALAASLSNVPALPGRTLVVVDQSPSMFPQYGFPQVRSDMTNADMAKLFGSAVALRAEHADLVGYGVENYPVPVRKGDAVLRVMDRFHMENGTDTFGAIAAHYTGHRRVIIVTDEQNQSYQYGSIDDVVPTDVPVYLWNIGGYATGSIGSGPNRHTIGGMTDAAFRLVPLIEAGRTAAWPWETEQQTREHMAAWQRGDVTHRGEEG